MINFEGTPTRLEKCHLHRSWLAGDPLLLELLQDSCLQGHLHRNCYTGVATQELLHRSSANFQVIKLYLNSCKIRLLQFFNFSLAAGTARRWLTKRYPLRRVGHPSVWRNAGLVCPWATLCGDRACRMGKHVVWWNAKLLCPQQLSAEIVRFERPSMWWNVNFFWARAALCRDRAGRTSKHVAKFTFGGAPRSPFARNEGQPSKTDVKLWFWKFRCKRRMKVKTAITVRENCEIF